MTAWLILFIILIIPICMPSFKYLMIYFFITTIFTCFGGFTYISSATNVGYITAIIFSPIFSIITFIGFGIRCILFEKQTEEAEKPIESLPINNWNR